MNNSRKDEGLVAFPVVLHLSSDQAALLEQLGERYNISVSDVATDLVAFALHSLSQVGDIDDANTLQSALLRRLEVDNSLTHRLGIGLAETERMTLLVEALSIEARHILARLHAPRT